MYFCDDTELITPPRTKGSAGAVYFNRRGAIGGLGRSPKPIAVQRGEVRADCTNARHEVRRFGRFVIGLPEQLAEPV